MVIYCISVCCASCSPANKEALLRVIKTADPLPLLEGVHDRPILHYSSQNLEITD